MSHIDELFYGARDDLKRAQTKLHELLGQVQDNHHGVDSSAVADVLKATAKAIQEMDEVAQTWQAEAAKASSNETVDYTVFSRDKLFYSKPQTLDEVCRASTFDFDRFLVSTEDDGA